MTFHQPKTGNLDKKMSSIWEGTWVLSGLRRIPSLLMASHQYWRESFRNVYVTRLVQAIVQQ